MFYSEYKYVNIVLVLNLKTKINFNSDQQLMFICLHMPFNHILQNQNINKYKNSTEVDTAPASGKVNRP